MHEYVDRLPDTLTRVADELDAEFERLLVESSTLAFRVAYGVLRQREDAEDVAQEAFIKAHRNFRRLRDRPRFRSWLVRLTWRLAIDRQRANRRRSNRDTDRRAARKAAPPADSRRHRRARHSRGGAPAPGDAVETGDSTINIDRELRRALAATPSPEFVARVRTRIADAPRQSMMPGLLKCTAPIACVAALAIALGVREHAPATATTSVLSITAYRPLRSAPLQSLTTVAAPTFIAAKAPIVVVKESLPKVMIVPERVAAVEYIIRNASEFVVSVDERAPASAWTMNDLTVAPITIEPLELAAAHNN